MIKLSIKNQKEILGGRLVYFVNPSGKLLDLGIKKYRTYKEAYKKLTELKRNGFTNATLTFGWE